MGSVSLYLKDPSASRFVAGGLPEVELLFGHPLPEVPPPDVEDGRAVFWVRFHPDLRQLMHRYLTGLLLEIGALPGSPAARGGGGAQEQYEAALLRVLKSVRANDRRMGLNNLFWLALTRDVAESLREMEGKTPAVRKLKYSLHPLLSSFYKRLDQQARRATDQNDADRLLAGGRENPSLVEALLEDGFAFTELSIADLDFNQFLAANKRYRISADLFFEIYQLMVRETERRLREGDRSLLARLNRHLPGLPKSLWSTQSGVVKVMMNVHVMTYLFADVWQTGAKLAASARLRAEAERRRPGEVMDVFLDLVAGVKRFEILSLIRDRVSLLRAFESGREQPEPSSRGLRLYEFGESAQVLNNAVNAAVLFLDLRGFTQTSEGQISERDLTRELYTVFDALVPHVRRFGGSVDKFLGDGIMATFGTAHADPLDALNALRCAILCQDTLRHLRDEGRTYFKMGVAIHYGRVYIARFIADEESVQTTVIGRNVNLAGRLSSASKRPLEEDEELEQPLSILAPYSPKGTNLHVGVDSFGTLLNEGIAVSRDTLSQLEAHLPLVQTEDDGQTSFEYFDETIGRRILLRYAGDAKFKGVRSSVPVYAVDFEA